MVRDFYDIKITIQSFKMKEFIINLLSSLLVKP